MFVYYVYRDRQLVETNRLCVLVLSSWFAPVHYDLLSCEAGMFYLFLQYYSHDIGCEVVPDELQDGLETLMLTIAFSLTQPSLELCCLCRN